MGELPGGVLRYGVAIAVLRSMLVCDLDLDVENPSLLVRGEKQKAGKIARGPIHPETGRGACGR